VSEAREARWLVLPTFTLLALFVALPFAVAIAFSLTDLRLGSPYPPRFVGLQQYLRLAHDPSFRQALSNNVLFAAAVVPLQTALALVLALALDRPLAGISVYRTLFFLPVAFPMTLVAVVWEAILGPYLRQPELALPSLILLSVWQGVGFQTVILLAGLQAVPTALHEAASLDGASPWQRFVHVTLPGLRNSLTFTALMTTILAFKVFDQVQILTRGGPAEATTTVLFLMVRTCFERLQVGQASALAVVFFLLIMGLTAMQRLALPEETE